MDKVIVTGLLVIAAVTAAVLVIASIVPSIGSSGQSVVESQRQAADRIKTNIEIIAVAPNATGTQIDGWVKNVGVVPIDSIDKSDVFLIKQGSRFDAITYYSGSGDTNKTWTGDLKQAGMPWNRGDTLRITISLSGTDVLGTGDHVLRISTPNGITAEKTFSR